MVYIKTSTRLDLRMSTLPTIYGEKMVHPSSGQELPGC